MNSHTDPEQPVMVIFCTRLESALHIALKIAATRNSLTIQELTRVILNDWFSRYDPETRIR